MEAKYNMKAENEKEKKRVENEKRYSERINA
jgi:hypothetical protein